MTKYVSLISLIFIAAVPSKQKLADRKELATISGIQWKAQGDGEVMKNNCFIHRDICQFCASPRV